jgi:branched-subunit amino acid aminotransferase/4-amino-4-deoxychorismate lyase
MSTLANERVAWFNGKIVPEHEVRIPFRDSSWLYGDGAFDMTRSFGGKPFKLKEHMERFYRSLKYLRIDPGMSAEKMIAVSEDVFERNRHLLGPDEDYWIGQRVSRGVKDVPGDNLDYHGPNVVVECMPLPFRQRARLFIEGIKVMVPSHRRTPPESLTPRAKTHNYLNLIVANQEIHAIDPSAWAILLDANGNLCEGLGSNIFVRQARRNLHPTRKVCATRRVAADGNRSGARSKANGEGGRSRPLRRVQCRGDIHHFDLSVLVPGGVGERGARGAGGSGVGADYQETRGCLYPLC